MRDYAPTRCPRYTRQDGPDSEELCAGQYLAIPTSTRLLHRQNVGCSSYNESLLHTGRNDTQASRQKREQNAG